MSQSPSPANQLAAAVPADLKCGFCQKPVVGAYYRALGRFACINCAGQVKDALARNILTPQVFLTAAAAGLAIGLACAAAWAAIVHVTNYELGIVASFIGYAVGRGVYTASGKRRGPALQWLACGLSVVGIIGGKLMLTVWYSVDSLNHKGIAATPMILARIMKAIFTDADVFASVFHGFDLLWIGIAVYAALRICKAPHITIAGPYQLAPPQAAGLQFETVEPATPAAPEQP